MRKRPSDWLTAETAALIEEIETPFHPAVLVARQRPAPDGRPARAAREGAAAAMLLDRRPYSLGEVADVLHLRGPRAAYFYLRRRGTPRYLMTTQPAGTKRPVRRTVVMPDEVDRLLAGRLQAVRSRSA